MNSKVSLSESALAIDFSSAERSAFPVKDSNDNTVYVALNGRLGNQLFIWNFGQWLSDSFGLEPVFVRIVSKEAKRKRRSHRILLGGRGLAGAFVDDYLPAPFPQRSLFAHPSILIQALRKNPSFSPPRNSPPIAPKEVGFSSLPRPPQPGTLLTGYWQSWRYCMGMGGRSPRISASEILLREGQSDWFTAKAAEARDARPIVAHLRRGDYLVAKLGVVAEAFFVRAIEGLRKAGNSHSVWIFSDDPLAAAYLAHQIQGEVRVIIAPEDSDPAESIWLMAQASAHVISNSTYGWWGAFLNPHNPTVIAPDPWFVSGETPRDLLPPHWATAPAEFLAQ